MKKLMMMALALTCGLAHAGGSAGFRNDPINHDGVVFGQKPPTLEVVKIEAEVAPDVLKVLVQEVSTEKMYQILIHRELLIQVGGRQMVDPSFRMNDI